MRRGADGVERVAFQPVGIDGAAGGVVGDGNDAGADEAGVGEADGDAGAAGLNGEEAVLVGVADGVGAVAAAGGEIEFPKRAVVTPGEGGHEGAVFTDAVALIGERELAGAGHTLHGTGRNRGGDDLVGDEADEAVRIPAVE